MSIARVRALVVVAGLAGLLVALLPGVLPASAAGKVAPEVYQQTDGGRSASFMVLLSARADLAPAAALETKQAKGRFVVAALRDTADRAQGPVRALLDRMGVTYRSHFIVDALTVTGGRAVVDALAARTDVARIVPNPWVRSTILPTAPARPASAAPDTIEWNVSRVRAPKVWGTGNTGQGIVLGNIDTGQQWNHPALKPHYRGWNGSTADHNFNWYDATNPNNRAPLDPYGHGTHTAGTMVGDDGGSNQIGVAPGAMWFSCRSMDASGFGSPDTYVTCLEFMIAPWNLDGQNPNPDLAPVAVSNSWFCSISQEGCSQDSLIDAVTALRAAGIVPIFSAGNSGPTCRTIGNDGPAAQYDESFTVGATTMSNVLAGFSSRGPASFMGHRLLKPDIVAPGDLVRSSYPTNTYAVLSGTSMASPHIAGAIALLYAARPDLIGNVDATETQIETTARHTNSSECNSNGTYPNNLYGYGLVDAAAAVRG
jgi:subtilisin family serine protease